jgi:AcrR family transcriptional regulator
MTTTGTKEERRERILDAASELFARRGFAATGVDEIGAAAGITGPAVYRYIGSKDEILYVLMHRGLHRLLESADDRLPADEPADVRLRSLASTFVAQAFELQSLAAILWNELRHVPDETQALLEQLYDRRVAQWLGPLRELRPDRADAELRTLVDGVYGLIVTAVMTEPRTDTPERREVIRDMALRAVVPDITNTARR